MPPLSPEEQSLYPTKTLRFKLCDFFLEKRIKFVGLGNAFDVRLQEMAHLLRDAVGNNDNDRKLALYDELRSLHSDRFDEPRRSVIDISHFPERENFIEAFENNQSLQINCLSKDIDDYMTKLRNGTRSAVKHNRPLQLIPLPGGGVMIVLRDKEMDITKTKELNINLRASIVKLMFGKPVSTPIGNVSMEDIVGDYNIGDVIILENLLDAILNIEGLVEDEDSVDMTKKMKSVKDAVDGLNDRALEIFDTDLFDGVGENLRWVLGV